MNLENAPLLVSHSDGRKQIVDLIKNNCVVYQKICAWGEEHKRDNRLLLEQTPNGFADWFVVNKDESIWYVSYDSSDGGGWSSEGVTVTGYAVRFQIDLALRLRDLQSDKDKLFKMNTAYAKAKKRIS